MPSPKTKLQLFKPGLNKTLNGDFTFDVSMIDTIIQNQKLKDTRDRLPIDIAHLSLTSDNPDAHKAVGWFELLVDETGIYADKITYTDETVASIQKEEFRYFSPVINVDEDGNITQIINNSLTNEPASLDIEPIALSTSLMSKSGFPKEEKQKTSFKQVFILLEKEPMEEEDKNKITEEEEQVEVEPLEVDEVDEVVIEEPKSIEELQELNETLQEAVATFTAKEEEYITQLAALTEENDALKLEIEQIKSAQEDASKQEAMEDAGIVEEEQEVLKHLPLDSIKKLCAIRVKVGDSNTNVPVRHIALSKKAPVAPVSALDTVHTKTLKSLPSHDEIKKMVAEAARTSK